MFDIKAALMTMLKEAIKVGRGLKTSLVAEAIAILKEAHKSAGEIEYAFMSTIGIGKDKPIGQSATTNAIKRIIDPRTGTGFGTEFTTSYGFRHTASTMLNELEHPIDVIELRWLI